MVNRKDGLGHSGAGMAVYVSEQPVKDITFAPNSMKQNILALAAVTHNSLSHSLQMTNILLE